MKSYRVEFCFDQGNTIVHEIKAVDKASVLSNIPTNGTFEFTNEKTGNIYRITVNLVKYILVSELEAE
ncbi:hypothetical protein [Planococcus salinus]|uniref:Uncharacterized protein n=1 Tax=Planococcus salinus TaxID=1848460 RepID=A0A3M8PA53_9BACL|nr:hypothetical protein [Planococcus salinus]RNF40557.1 hypothetical protein EEX84_03795 [Planococcus salinus]